MASMFAVDKTGFPVYAFLEKDWLLERRYAYPFSVLFEVRFCRLCPGERSVRGGLVSSSRYGEVRRVLLLGEKKDIVRAGCSCLWRMVDCQISSKLARKRV